MVTNIRLRLALAAIAVDLAVLAPQTCAAANLLYNGDFENTQGPYLAADYAGNAVLDMGWYAQCWTAAGAPYTSYVRRESTYYQNAAEPEGVGNGPWEAHSGTEASRHCTSKQGHIRVWQLVEVTPGMTYDASVWLKAVDVDGYGFGVAGSGDWAGLHIAELAADCSLVLDHTPISISSPTGYTKVGEQFTAQAGTTYVQFIMETHIGGAWGDYGHWQHGWVTYDDAVLESVPEPSSLLALGSMLSISGLVWRRRR